MIPPLFTPSIRVLLMLVGVPFAEKFTERLGLAAKEFPFCAGETPGSVTTTIW
jgi:hypothetical protein